MSTPGFLLSPCSSRASSLVDLHRLKLFSSVHRTRSEASRRWGHWRWRSTKTVDFPDIISSMTHCDSMSGKSPSTLYFQFTDLSLHFALESGRCFEYSGLPHSNHTSIKFLVMFPPYSRSPWNESPFWFLDQMFEVKFALCWPMSSSRLAQIDMDSSPVEDYFGTGNMRFHVLKGTVPFKKSSIHPK